ncbi:MAG: hypothetical protein ACLPN5_16635 [Roseiarcus sp.]
MSAPRVAHWLALAAAPTFASMALGTVLFSGRPDLVCGAMRGSSPMSAMTVMYLLMSAFHLAPWLRLFSRRPGGAGGTRADAAPSTNAALRAPAFPTPASPAGVGPSLN